MTITSTPSEVSYDGDDVSVSFPIPFVFDTGEDLKVIQTDADGNPVILSAGFSVSGGAGSTGSLTLDTALPTGETLTILDDPERKQSIDYIDNDSFPAESAESGFDRNTRLVKRLYELVLKSLRVIDGDPAAGDGMLLGSVDNRKGKYLFFNAITGAVEYAIALATETLSQSIIAQFLNPQIPEESALGLTPVNYWYLPANALRYKNNDEQGVTVMTTALQAAVDVGEAANIPYVFPAGTYLFSSIILKGNGSGESFYSVTGTVLRTTITSGFAITSDTSYTSLENIMVMADTASPGTAGGFQLGVDAASPVTRYQYKNLYARGFTGGTGIHMAGWIGVGTNLWADDCLLGLYGEQLNGTDLTVQIENCDVSAEFVDCISTRAKVLAEADGRATTTHGIKIDGGSGLTLDTPHLEFASCANLISTLAVGATTEVAGFKTSGGHIFVDTNPSNTVLYINKVDGLDLAITVNDAGVDGLPMGTSWVTSLTKNVVRFDVMRITNDGFFLADQGFATPTQYVPDPYLITYLSQFNRVPLVNATLSEDTTNVMHGARGIKIDATAASSAANAGLYLTELLPQLQGKTIDVGAWIWMPDITPYNGSDPSSPGIRILDNVGGKSSDLEMVYGKWNFVVVRDFTVDAAATFLDFIVYAINASGADSDGTENVTVDSLFIWDSQYSETKIVNGEFHQSTIIGWVEGANFVGVGAHSTDGNSHYTVGDRFMDDAPAAAGTIGEVCTTAGGPGTWKTFGTIAA